jgi:hypothetical protein
MAIRSDSSGFIIGERRAKEMADGIKQTKVTVKEILDVLTDQFRNIERSITEGSSINEILLREVKKTRDSTREITGPAHRKAQNAEKEQITYSRKAAIDVVEASIDKVYKPRRSYNADDPTIPNTSNKTTQSSKTGTAERAEKARDARGRFIGADGGSGGGGDERSLLSRFGDRFKGGGIDSGGIDPGLDAIREVRDFMQPIANVFDGMPSKAIGWLRGRKKRRSDEVLPEEQYKANKDEKKSNTQRNRLLQKLIDAVRSGGRGGLLGKMFGGGRAMLGLAGGALKFIGKRVPLLAALFGGGALAKNWGGMDSGQKGKGIGKLVGGLGGGLLGSLLGPAGTVAGGTLGVYLGGIFGQKVGEWTDGLKKIDFSKQFQDIVSKAFEVVKKGANATFIPYRAAVNATSSGMEYVANAGKKAWEGAKGAGGYIAEKLGAGGANSLSNLIGSREGGYNTVNLGKRYGYKAGKRDLTNMTVAEVMAAQDRKEFNAAGKFQIIQRTMQDVYKGMKLTGKEKFDESFQEKAGAYLAFNRKNLADFITGKSKDIDAAGNDVAQEWSSFPMFTGPNKGKTNYQDGVNKAHHTIGDTKKMILSMQEKYQEAIASGKTEKEAQLIAFRNMNVEKAPEKAAIPPAKNVVQPATRVAGGAATKPAQKVEVFGKTPNRPKPVPVPAVTPALVKIGNKSQAVRPGGGSESLIPQEVSDRGLAHIASGGLGRKNR